MTTKKRAAVKPEQPAPVSGEIRPAGATLKGGAPSGGRITAQLPKSGAVFRMLSGAALAKGTVKRSVTFSAEIDARAHELVGERGFSAFVNEATKSALQFAVTDQLIAEFEAAHGPITDDELDQARRALQQARKRRS